MWSLIPQIGRGAAIRGQAHSLPRAMSLCRTWPSPPGTRFRRFAGTIGTSSTARESSPVSRENLTAELIQLIKVRGPITVSEFMKLCLTHPKYGYYMKKDVFGTAGDFITAPEVSQLFGEMIGVWCVMLWKQMGAPRDFDLIELGPGRGTLMQDILRATKVFPEFQQAVNISLCEASPAMQRLQYESLTSTAYPPDKMPSVDLDGAVTSSDDLGAVKVSWCEHFVHRLVHVERPSITIGQEFIDALPVHQFEFTEEYGWVERLVDYTPGRHSSDELRFVLSPGPTNAARTFKPFLPATVIGGKVEICPQGLGLTEMVSKNIQKHGGGALFIDYGHDTRTGLTLQGIKDHEFVEILEQPGEIDLSAYVDFQAMSEMVTRVAQLVPGDVRAVASPVMTQGDFLAGMGVMERVEMLCRNASKEQQESIISGYNRLCSPDEMGTRYKAFAISRADQGDLHPFCLLPPPNKAS